VPDRAYGFVMLGGTDNSKITKYAIGTGGDWLWAGLVASYQINESLKLTGNFVYADVDAWTEYGDGPKGAWAGELNEEALDSAWELSAVLQYTISKGADVYFSAGYLKPDFEYSNYMLEDDAAFAALTRFELKF
jgi:predicted porin